MTVQYFDGRDKARKLVTVENVITVIGCESGNLWINTANDRIEIAAHELSSIVDEK